MARGEVWAPIEGFPGYTVSDQGRIRDDRGDEVETYIYNRAGERWVFIQKGEWSYRGPVWKLVFADIFRGDHSDIEVQFVDGDLGRPVATNLRLLYPDPDTGEMGILKIKRNRSGYFMIDKRSFIDLG
jgi:hypothetical protein